MGGRVWKWINETSNVIRFSSNTSSKVETDWGLWNWDISWVSRGTSSVLSLVALDTWKFFFEWGLRTPVQVQIHFCSSRDDLFWWQHRSGESQGSLVSFMSLKVNGRNKGRGGRREKNEVTFYSSQLTTSLNLNKGLDILTRNCKRDEDARSTRKLLCYCFTRITKGLQYITYKGTLPTSDKPQQIKVTMAEKRRNLFNHAHK